MLREPSSAGEVHNSEILSQNLFMTAGNCGSHRVYMVDMDKDGRYEGYRADPKC
jgi:hypothetical protein